MDAFMKITRCGQGHKKIPPAEWIERNGSTIVRIYLGEDKDSYVDLGDSDVAHTIDFDQAYELHPEERDTIKIYGKERKVPRWQQSYGRDYYFSGEMHEAKPLPDIFVPLVEEIHEKTGMPKPNQFLVNWYQDGSDYIGAHSDDERQMVRGPRGESTVYSLTLQEDPGNRIFRLKPKVPKKGALPEAERKLLGKERIDIELKHGLVVMMGGLCQVQYKHQVPATKKTVGRRINVTMRWFHDS